MIPDGCGTIDLIRHGEPVGGRRYRGQVDDPLSDKGWDQMWAAVGEEPSWHVIVTSPLQRCRAFARALGDRHGINVVEEPRFKEVRFGNWEGRKRSELESEPGAPVARFYRDPVNNRPPGAEPLDEFVARVVAGWSEWVESHGRENTLVVAHAGVIRSVLVHLLEIPVQHMYRINVENAGVTRIALPADRPPVVMSHCNCFRA